MKDFGIIHGIAAMASAAPAFLRTEIVIPAISTLFGAGIAAGVLLTQISGLQQNQGKIVAVIEKVVADQSVLSEKHNFLATEYRAAVASRDRRMVNDDERHADNRRRLDALEARVFHTTRDR